jgi:hypothetical protein
MCDPQSPRHFVCISPHIQSTEASAANLQSAPRKQLTFRPNGNSDIYDPYGGSLFVSHSFVASNGEWAELYWRKFDSSTDTARYVHLHMEGVTKILERSAKFNDKRENVGEKCQHFQFFLYPLLPGR